MHAAAASLAKLSEIVIRGVQNRDGDNFMSGGMGYVCPPTSGTE